MSKWHTSQAVRYGGPLLILLLAAWLRFLQPDVYIMWIDEISIHKAAIDVARAGQFTLVGNISTFDALAYHSPLTTYLIALPYLIAPEPALARLFVAALGLLTVALVYRMTRRYFGLPAAFIAGLLFAVVPVAVDWSRYVWNPNVGQIFLALWLFTALIGYYEGRLWAQGLHWLALSATIQSQAALLTLIPMTLAVTVLYLWARGRQTRVALLRASVVHVGILSLTALTFVPWLVGLGQVDADAAPISPTEAIAEQTLQIQMPDLVQLAGTFGRVVGSVDFPGYRIGWSDVQTGLWSQPFFVAMTVFQALLVLVCTLTVMVWAARRPRQRIPHLFIALMVAYPFGLFVVNLAGEQFADFYFMVALFAGVIVLAVGLGSLWQRGWRRPVAVGVALLATSQMTITLAYVDFLARSGGDYPVGNLVTARQQAASWQAQGPDLILLREPVVEADLPPPQRFTLYEVYLLWDVLSERYNLRVFTPEDNLRVAGPQTVLIGLAQSQLLARWLPDTQASAYAGLVSGVLPPALLVPDYTPVDPANFEGLARLMGAQLPDTFEPGEELPVRLIWQPLQTAPQMTLQFSLRLVDETGRVLSQQDRTSLAYNEWKTGDTVLTEFRLPPSEPTPPDTSLALQVVMYTLPDVQSLTVIDDSGQSAAPYSLIPLTSSHAAPAQ